MARSDTRLWHPFSDMALVRGNEFVVTRGEGIWLEDDAGRRYIDGSGSLWYANVGHGRRDIAQAVARQLEQLEAFSIFGEVANPPALELAERLAERAPFEGGRVFFGCGGGDGIETASKLARLYWQTLGQPGRDHLISRANAYHGSQAFGTSLGGIPANRVGFDPLMPGTSQVPFDSPQALRAEIERVGPEKVAAFFAEPVMGAGGVLLPPPGYFEEISRICRETGVLFVCDAVISGFGRLGTWFGIERFGVEPDMVVFAKGVTSGYMPLGGVIASERVAEPFWSQPGRAVFRHGQTFSGHQVCCAAALEVLDIYEREQLIPRGRELEGTLAEALEPLRSHPLVGDVRCGLGLIAAVELEAGLLEREPTAPARFSKAVREEGGVLLRSLGRALAVCPPLTIEPDEIRTIADAIRAGLDAMQQGALVGEPAGERAGA